MPPFARQRREGRAPDVAPATMPATLRLVAAEIGVLADAAEGLQVPIVELILRAGPKAAAQHPELQNLDLLTQALQALATFTSRLAEGMEREQAARDLGLADLERRLRGAAPETDQPRDDGGVLFFGD